MNIYDLIRFLEELPEEQKKLELFRKIHDGDYGPLKVSISDLFEKKLYYYPQNGWWAQWKDEKYEDEEPQEIRDSLVFWI